MNPTDDGTPLPPDLHRDGEDRTQTLERWASLLAATLDATTDGVLVVDRERRIVAHNRRFAELWGIPGDVLASRDDTAARAFALSQLEDPRAFDQRVEQVYAAPALESRDTLLFLDGRVVERASKPHWLGSEIVGRVWAFRDVTEQRRSEQALRESEHRYRLLFEKSQTPIYITTIDGHFVDANPAAVELFGYPRETLFRLPATKLYADPADRRRFRDAVEAGGVVRDFEVQLKRSNGEVIDVPLSAALHRNVAGGDLRVHFQPIVSLPDGKVFAFEALARWWRPNDDILLPADFIPLAEQGRLIEDIDLWVLKETCRHAADWRIRHKGRPTWVSVNVSGVH